MKPAPFRLGRVLVGAALILGARRAAVLAAITPLLALQLATVVMERAAPESAVTLAAGVALLTLALYILTAVNVHRLVLLGPEAVPRFGLGRFGLREWRYLGGYALQFVAGSLAMVAAAPLLPLAGREVTILLAVLAGAWVAGRLAMLLPGIAVDRPLDLRSAWRLGAGAGFRLAAVAVGVPALGVALVWPAVLSPSPLLEVFALLFTDAMLVWGLAAQSLAWQTLGRGAGHPGSGHPGSGPPETRIALEPDASRGLLTLRLAGPFATQELGHLAARDGLVAYHGRLRGLVIDLDPASWDPDLEGGQGWTALDTMLSHLAFVRLHHESLERVAVVGATGWAPRVADLAKHFGRAELRFFPAVRGRSAGAWAVREAD